MYKYFLFLTILIFYGCDFLDSSGNSIVINPSVTENHIIFSNESSSLNNVESTGTLNPSTSININLNKKTNLNTKTRVNPLINSPRKINIPKVFKNIIPRATIPSIGTTKEFNTINFITYSNEKKWFELKYVGSNCIIWAERDDTTLTITEMQKIGLEFDQKIFNLVQTNFANHFDQNNDGVVSILVFDIKDGYNGSSVLSYTGGYFNPGDILTTLQNINSNVEDIIYIDTYPTMKDNLNNLDVTGCFSTIVHEFQHMVNFHSYWTRSEKTKNQPRWMNEGLSMAAEHIYNNGQLNSRIDYFNNDINDSIKNGKSIIEENWENTTDVLANYSLAYLYLQYIKSQTTNNNTIYKELIDLSYNDYRSIDTVLAKYSSLTNNSFSKSLTNFRAATLINNSNGVYGFNGNIIGITAPINNTNIDSINLNGGSAIIRKNNDTFTPTGEGPNIKIVGINK